LASLRQDRPRRAAAEHRDRWGQRCAV